MQQKQTGWRKGIHMETTWWVGAAKTGDSPRDIEIIASLPACEPQDRKLQTLVDETLSRRPALPKETKNNDQLASR
jgi:hypothetical protein